jgi:hypothetical protein
VANGSTTGIFESSTAATDVVTLMSVESSESAPSHAKRIRNVPAPPRCCT